MTERAKIPRDAFTEKLLAVWIALVKMDAIRYKKDFTTTVGLTLSEFYQIEREMRNYPKDELKRSQARINLFDKYGVNPTYLSGASNTMLVRKPEVAKRVTGTGKVTKVPSVKKLLDYEAEIEQYKAKVAELESALADCMKDPVGFVKATTKKSRSKKKLINPQMKNVILVLLILSILTTSCKKKYCWTCIVKREASTGGIKSSTSKTEEKCDLTKKEIKEFEGTRTESPLGVPNTIITTTTTCSQK